MSELSMLANSPSGLIPGYTLSRLNASAIGAIEESFKRYYIALAARATVELTSESQNSIVSRAAQDADFYFVDGTVAFRRKCESSEGMITTIVESIRIRHANADYKDILAKCDGLEKAVLKEAADWCWGIERKKAPGQSEGTGTGETAKVESAGAKSSEESLPATS